MSSQLSTARHDLALAIEQVLVTGDLARLSSEQRVEYYNRVCESVGLNPLTRPFDYLTLNDKLVLYARKDATDQLRKRDQINIAILSREVIDGVYIVTAQARTGDGRSDESTGAVPLVKEGGTWEESRQGGKRFFKADGTLIGLKPEDKANAMMKAETKAKRRVTLSICGLGMLDESEIESIPGARRFEDVPPRPAPIVRTVDQPADGAVFTIENEEQRQPREADKLSTCNTCGATIAWAHINGRSLPYEVVDGVRQDARHMCSSPAPAAKVYTPAQREKMIGKIRQQMRDLDPQFTDEERRDNLTMDLEEMDSSKLAELGSFYKFRLESEPGYDVMAAQPDWYKSH